MMIFYRRSLATLVLLTFLSGCSGTHTARYSPPIQPDATSAAAASPLNDLKAGEQIIVILHDGTRIDGCVIRVDQDEVELESSFERRGQYWVRVGKQGVVVISCQEIDSIQFSSPEGMTGLSILLGVVGLVVGVYLVASASAPNFGGR